MYNLEKILMYIHKSQEQELFYRRRRELQVFSWSNAILLATSGGILSSYRENPSNINTMLISLRFLITIFIICITFFSVKWQLYQRKRAAKHQQILSTLSQKLGCFDGNDPVFPKEWRDWGNRYTTLKEHLIFPSKISATLLLGFLALTCSWLDLLISLKQ